MTKITREPHQASAEIGIRLAGVLPVGRVSADAGSRRQVERLTLVAPELRSVDERRAIVRTATGISIGGAYMRPMPPMTEDGELVQRALLAYHDEPHVAAMTRVHREPPAEPWGAKWAHRIVTLILVGMLCWLFAEWMGWAR